MERPRVREFSDPDWDDFSSSICDWVEGDTSGLVQAARNRIAFAEKAKRIPHASLKTFDETWPLPFNPTYGSLTGLDLSKTDPALFERAKTALRARGEGRECWACRLPRRSSPAPFDAHEFWKWRDPEGLRILSAIRFLCKDCHYLVHHVYWLFVMIPDQMAAERVAKYLRVNRCTFIEAYAHAAWALENARRRSKKQWTIELSAIADLLPQLGSRPQAAHGDSVS